jgi:hypothetical protein
MEMINRLTADALDSQKFVDRLKQIERTDALQVQRERFAGENRTQRRARERAERKAIQRKATARP